MAEGSPTKSRGMAAGGGIARQGVWLVQGVLGVAGDPRKKPDWQPRPSLRQWYQIRGRKVLHHAPDPLHMPRAVRPQARARKPLA